MLGRLAKRTDVIQHSIVIHINSKDFLKFHHASCIHNLALAGGLIAVVIVTAIATARPIEQRAACNVSVGVVQTVHLLIIVIDERKLAIGIIGKRSMVSFFARRTVFNHFLYISVSSQGCYPSTSGCLAHDNLVIIIGYSICLARTICSYSVYLSDKSVAIVGEGICLAVSCIALQQIVAEDVL